LCLPTILSHAGASVEKNNNIKRGSAIAASVTGLDFDKLMANQSLKKQVTEVMQKTFAAAAGVESKDVTITYRKGSVVVEASIRGKELDASKMPRPVQVAGALKEVNGIEKTLEQGKQLEDLEATDVQSTLHKPDKALRGTSVGGLLSSRASSAAAHQFVVAVFAACMVNSY